MATTVGRHRITITGPTAIYRKHTYTSPLSTMAPHVATLCALLAIMLSPFLVSSSAAARCVITAGQLTIETLPSPVLGIDSATPRLGWWVVGVQTGAADDGGAPPPQNQTQSAYRIQCASSPAALAKGSADLWDSQKVRVSGSV